MSDEDNISIHDNDSIIEEYENNETPNDPEGSNDNKGRIVDPPSKKRNKRSDYHMLNTKRLRVPKKGIHTIEKYFEGFKFYGKGHEKEDLNRIMKRMEHWAHRLYPKFHFDDFLGKCEKLGSKRDVQVFIKRYRLDMIDADYDETKPDNADDNDMDDQNDENNDDVPMNEFDMLLEEQLERTKHVQSTQNSTFDQLLEQLDRNKQVLDSSSEHLTPVANLDNTSVIGNNIQNDLETREAIKQRIEKNRQEALRRRAMRLEALSKENNSNEDVSLGNLEEQHNEPEMTSCNQDNNAV